MERFVEIHVLQNVAPSNLNRDDTGAPKDAIFGGRRRARISSQCSKRAIRRYFQEQVRDGRLEENALAVRTKRLLKELVGMLEKRGKNSDEAERKIKAAFAAIKFVFSEENGKSQYLLFLGRREIEKAADVIVVHWDELEVEEPASDKKGKSKKDKAKASSSAVRVELERLLDGGKAVDLALFGRMLADLPEKNQDAACQVAHAISTHAVEREFDYYTAVDDLKPEDTAGADMIGSIEFNSACYYRYALIDLEKLQDNLQGDRELANLSVRIFLEGFTLSRPTGKQNSFAAHNPPEYVRVCVRRGGYPVNLANAFEKPVSVAGGKSLTEASIKSLQKKAAVLEKAFLTRGTSHAFELKLSSEDNLQESDVSSFDQLLDEVMESVRAE